MDNLQTYCDDSVVAHYAAEAELLPPERYLFGKYVKPGMAILDVGVGGGRTAAHLAPGAARYLGVDYSPAMVAACRARFPELEFVVGDASDLSAIADSSFDFVVFSFNGIDYLPSDAARQKALAEFGRVTRPGGHVIISSHSARQVVELPVFEGADLPRKVWRLARALGRTLKRTATALPSGWFWKGRGYVVDPVHGGLMTHVSSPASIAADCATAGLEIVETAGAFHPHRVPEWANNWTTYVLRRKPGA